MDANETWKKLVSFSTI